MGRATPSRICFEFGFEELLEFVAALDAGAEGALAEVFHDDGGGGGAEVGGEEERLEVDEGGFVDLAGEGDDGADGLGEGLAGAGDRLLHAVEEAELRAGTPMRIRGLGWFRFVAFSEEREKTMLGLVYRIGRNGIRGASARV